jgi:hypothetical protein
MSETSSAEKFVTPLPRWWPPIFSVWLAPSALSETSTKTSA